MSSVTKRQFNNDVRLKLTLDKKASSLNTLLFTNFKRNMSLDGDNVTPFKNHKYKVIIKHFLQGKKSNIPQNQDYYTLKTLSVFISYHKLLNNVGYSIKKNNSKNSIKIKLKFFKKKAKRIYINFAHVHCDF